MKNEKRKEKDEEKEKEEEKKIDTFYALLRGFREARDRRRKELEELEKSETKKRKTGTEQQHRVWVPSFEWEDFSSEVEFRGLPLHFSTPTTSPSSPATDKQPKNHKQLHDHSLDLNLAL